MGYTKASENSSKNASLAAHYRSLQLDPKGSLLYARTVHVVFYVLLIALPLGAWIANSLTGRSIDMFGLFTIPPLPLGENKSLGSAIFSAHATGGSIFIYLIGLHILGALKHTFFDKNGGIFRMLPFGKV